MPVPPRSVTRQNKPDRIIDAERLEFLVDGVSRYEQAVSAPTRLAGAGAAAAATGAGGLASHNIDPSGGGDNDGTSLVTAQRSALTAARIEQAATQIVDLLVADIGLDPTKLTPLQV